MDHMVDAIDVGPTGFDDGGSCWSWSLQDLIELESRGVLRMVPASSGYQAKGSILRPHLVA